MILPRHCGYLHFWRLHGRVHCKRGLGFGHLAFYCDEAVRTNRDRVDAAFYKKLGKLGVIARSLTAQADFGADLAGLVNDARDHPFDGWVLFVKEISQIAGIAIDAEGELGQVVGADREPVKGVARMLSPE